jgi:hypothetical protein
MIGIIRPVFGDRHFEGQFALTYKLKDGNRGEHLIHGSDLELGLRSIAHIPGDIGISP